MDLSLITSHELINLLISLIVTFVCHPILVHLVRQTFVGPLRLDPRWNAIKGFGRRCFGYLFIALFFTFFGVGVSLLPNPKFQAAVRDAAIDKVQPSPYAADAIKDLDLAPIVESMGSALIGSVLIICCLRIVVALYHESLVWSMVYAIMALCGFSLFTYLQNPKFYRLLFDSVIRPQFPGTVGIVALGCTTGALMIELMIDRYSTVQRKTAAP